MKNIELAKAGFANGTSLQLHRKQIDEENQNAKLSTEDKDKIIQEATIAYGNFLTALGVDWKNDPNSNNTPHRVAKAYVNDLWKGRYEPMGEITSFPSDGYSGIVQESNIPLVSMCSHHHQKIEGRVSIAYIPSKDGKVVGLSKLNRIVEHLSRRGSIQEQLTVGIHNAVNVICEDNLGVIVHISAEHSCVSCRGVRHQGASMQTTVLSGAFEVNPETRAEFYSVIK